MNDKINIESIDCGVCGRKIELEDGYYHIEVTDWKDEQYGTSEDFYYHRQCYRQKMMVSHA